MCRLKNRHFTLRRACTHLDHLAAHTHGDIGTLKPVCAYNKESVVFFLPLHSSTSRACTQFLGYLKNQRQTKTFPPLTPPPVHRGERGEKKCNRERNEGRKRERRTFEYRPQHGCQKKGDRRKEVNERRVDLTGRLFLRPE